MLGVFVYNVVDLAFYYVFVAFFGMFCFHVATTLPSKRHLMSSGLSH